MATDITLELAKKHVSKYAEQDRIMAQHCSAMKCRDCEDFLQLGIEAYQWIARADQTLRQAAVEGLDVPEEAKDVLCKLYTSWLTSCAHAEDRIREQEQQGFTVANAGRFRESRENVEQQLRVLEAHEALDEAFQGQMFDESFWAEAHRMRSS